MRKHLFLHLFLTCMFALAMYAQSSAGSMSGTITDPNGAAVPGAEVVAVHQPTGRSFSTQSSEAGLYVYPNLPPGPYEISVERAGFKKLIRTNVEIRLGTRQDLDLSLAVGDVQQRVEVQADAQLIETSTAERGSAISQQMLYNLPVYTGGLRSAEAFVGYMPGVNSAGETSINGSIGRAKEIFIDGASITVPESGGTNFYFPGFEAYQEMRLITSTFNAEYGRLGGGLEEFNTKSGTNSIHGAAFWNFRRDVLEAAGWASNARLGLTPGFRNKVRFNEQGGAAGGPIWIPKVYNGRNKSFFYFTYAKDLRPAGIVSNLNLTVPTALMRQGNFSELSYPIYDPATTATVNGVLTRQPFPGNIIPQNRWSKISANILPSIPSTTSGGVTGNYNFIGSNIHDDTIWTIKADHSLTQNNRLAFFMTRRNLFDLASTNFAGPLSGGQQNGQYPEDYRGNHDWVVKPTLIVHTTFGYSQTIQKWNQPEQSGFASKWGFPGLTGRSDQAPYINFATDNYTSWGRADTKVDNGGQFNYTLQWSQQISWVKGKHELKFGWDIRRLQTEVDDAAGSQGSYGFSRFQTADPANKTTTGNAFASFLLGAADNGSQLALPVFFPHIRYGYHAGFAQDSWRVTPKLTLTYGLRYEVPIGWHERDGNYANLDLTKPNPGAGNLPGAFVFAGVGGGRSGNKRFYPTDFTNLGPRAGFAYRLFDKTTLRGGYGIYYQTLGNGGCGCTNGFNASYSQLSDGINPAFNWDQGGVKPPAGFTAPPRLDPTISNFTDFLYRQGPNYGKAPRIYEWSFTVQHEIKNFLFEAAYVGNRGHGLNSSVYLNQLPTSYLSLGSLLGKNINDPAVVAAGYKEPFPGFAAGWRNGATLAQALRPFPQFGTVLDINAGVGRTWYDALQTKIERRFGGLQIIGSYVWSKSLGLMTYRQIFSQGAQVQTQDSYNIPDAKSYSPFDIPHVGNILTSYRLPFGRGQKYFSGVGRFTNLAVGGWVISAAQQYRTGTLIEILTNGNPNGAGVIFSPITKAVSTGAPIRTGISSTDLDPNNPSSRWLNPAAFTPAAAYTLGNASIYNNAVRNPWYRSENLSILKDFFITESIKFQYRADAINLFNRTVLGNINGTVGNANFGRPQSPMIGPRIISMGVRLEF